MKHLFSATFLILLSFSVAYGATQVPVEQGENQRRYVPKQLIVIFYEQVTEEQIERLAFEHGAQILSKHSGVNFYVLSILDEKSPLEKTEEFLLLPEVKAASPNWILVPQDRLRNM